MKRDRLRYLIEEYRLTQSQLDRITAEYVKNQTQADIFHELEKDLKEELEKAQNSKDASLHKQWQTALEQLAKDKSNQVDPEKLKSLSSEQAQQVVYYERKLKSIKKLLGDRIIELVDGYSEKNILIGDNSSSGNSLLKMVVKEEEDRKADQMMKKNKNVNFDKM
ncbi:MAG: hypothetical protein KKH93_05000 [Candidatus Omnitrophica bacterium]|nr:hypothetical protein [Candidatus Omnitrophota bacterium]